MPEPPLLGFLVRLAALLRQRRARPAARRVRPVLRDRWPEGWCRQIPPVRPLARRPVAGWEEEAGFLLVLGWVLGWGAGFRLLLVLG
ncbi:MAG TPA: hypothetical protein VFS21_39665 [Roseiflexaceae bacterium]|nr:hypothetical protein [Roseiflexaceae bacterium]